SSPSCAVACHSPSSRLAHVRGGRDRTPCPCFLRLVDRENFNALNGCAECAAALQGRGGQAPRYLEGERGAAQVVNCLASIIAYMEHAAGERQTRMFTPRRSGRGVSCDFCPALGGTHDKTNHCGVDPGMRDLARRFGGGPGADKRCHRDS